MINLRNGWREPVSLLGLLITLILIAVSVCAIHLYDVHMDIGWYVPGAWTYGFLGFLWLMAIVGVLRNGLRWLLPFRLLLLIAGTLVFGQGIFEYLFRFNSAMLGQVAMFLACGTMLFEVGNSERNSNSRR